MKTLAEFLARHVIDSQDYYGENAKKDYEEMIKWFAEDIAKGIEAYKRHLQNDSPKTVKWVMIEKGLISALEKMESHNHLNESYCDHRWVERLDGYEETCGPAICCLCGKYGCWCDAKWSEMTDKEKIDFHRHGVNGDEHKLEKKLKAKKIKKICLQSIAYIYRKMDCANCKLLLACTDRKNRHCEECLLFDLELQGNCREPGYGTKADNNACDRFKLNPQYFVREN